jgi:hypothetical protein
MFAFDEEAVAVLRLVGRVSDGRRATADDLRRALARPASTLLPPTRVRADAALADLLHRAAAIAAERGATEIGRADLVEATLEDAARSAGLDLSRLRFVRWRIARSNKVSLRP